MIDQTIFGRVGDRDGCRLHLMNILADVVAGGGDRLGRDLPSVAVEEDQLGAAGEEARSSGFIHLDVRVAMADDAAIRRAKRGERKAIGRRAGAYPESSNVGFEKFREGAVE